MKKMEKNGEKEKTNPGTLDTYNYNITKQLPYQKQDQLFILFNAHITKWNYIVYLFEYLFSPGFHALFPH